MATYIAKYIAAQSHAYIVHNAVDNLNNGICRESQQKGPVNAKVCNQSVSKSKGIWALSPCLRGDI